MKSVEAGEKVGNACRTAYYVWKSNKLKFGNIFSRTEQELSDIEKVINTGSIAKTYFLLEYMHIIHLSFDYQDRGDGERSESSSDQMTASNLNPNKKTDKKYCFTNELPHFIS